MRLHVMQGTLAACIAPKSCACDPVTCRYSTGSRTGTCIHFADTENTLHLQLRVFVWTSELGFASLLHWLHGVASCCSVIQQCQHAPAPDYLSHSSITCCLELEGESGHCLQGKSAQKQRDATLGKHLQNAAVPLLGTHGVCLCQRSQ